MVKGVAIISNVAVVLFALLIIPTQVKAEWTTDVYSGIGLTQNHDAQVNLPDAGITGTHESLKFDSSLIIGARGTYWIDTFSYLGFGLDVAHYFGPNQKVQTSMTTLCVQGFSCSTSPEHIKKFDNNVTAIGFDVMLRYPLLVSAQFTKGQLQPYLIVGPALFTATLKDTDNFIPMEQSSTSTSWGIEMGIGLTYLFTQKIGAFIEYRDSSFRAKDEYHNATVVHDITLGKTLGSATFNIQAILGGISFRF